MRGAWVAALAVVVAVVAPAAAQAATFSAATQYGNGITAAQTQFATADFNRDSAPDIAIAASAGVSVFLGNGTGGFGDPVGYASSPSGVATGDFNNDGKLDLASAESPGGVKTWLGNGAGDFTPSTNPAVGNRDLSIVSTDFNGDRINDLFVSWCGMNCAGGTPGVQPGLAALLSDGAGGFSAPHPATIAGTAAPNYVVTGDFNGDGKADIAVADEGGGGPNSKVLIYIGAGNGDFTPVGTPLTPAGNVQGAAAGDFNGDGKADLALGNSGKVTVYLADGAGGFGGPNDIPVGLAANGVAIGDFDNDGRSDLAVAGGTASANSVFILSGNGAGGFGASQTFATGGGTSVGVSGADLNRDGQTDVVITNNSGPNSVSVLLNQGVPAAALASSAFDFGRVQIGRSAAQTETLTNNGTGLLRVGTARLGGPDAAEFAFASDGCSGRTLVVGAACQVTVAFNPRVHAARHATLMLADNTAGSPRTVALTGTALLPTPVVSRYRLLRKKFAVSPRRPRGTAFLFRITQPSAVKITIQRRIKRRGKRVRYRSVGAISRNVLSGSRRIAFSGRIKRKKLSRGRYRAVLVATTDGGKSRAQRRSFQIVRGKKKR